MSEPDEPRSELRRATTEAERQFLAHLDRLGVEACGYLPADDPRCAQVREAYEEYRRAMQPLRPQPGGGDYLAELLNECQIERLVLFNLQGRGPAGAFWERTVEHLWQCMDVIGAQRGMFRPTRPLVRNAEEALDAVNVVVKWCEGLPPIKPFLVSLDDFCDIAGGGVAKKTIQNWFSERQQSAKWCPDPIEKAAGRRPNMYAYGELRRAVLEESPSLASVLPEDPSIAADDLQRVRSGKEQP